jgi:YgiT-type zinc finger domain-containing protein
MVDTLTRIKRAVLAGRFVFSEKAELEMERDGLTELDVAESILTAAVIHKTVRSTSRRRGRTKEKLHIIVSSSFTGALVYTKGQLVSKAGVDTYHFLVSSKKALYEATEMLDIRECPVCGSANIQRVRRDLRREFQGQAYVVPRLAFWECPDCGERLFDREAMRAIEAHSPAYAKAAASR